MSNFKNFIKKIMVHESETLLLIWIKLFLVSIYRSPMLGMFTFLYNITQSYRVSFLLFGWGILPRVYFSNNVFPVLIKRGRGVKLNIDCRVPIVFSSWISKEATTIELDDEASLSIKNTFNIGEGCKVSVGKNAELTLMGAEADKHSGITCRSIILCNKKIILGTGVIVSWNCYISDSSQHKINGHMNINPVFIGNNVWISEGVTCAPGTFVGDGCIVGSKSFLNKDYPKESLIVGQPAIVKKIGVSWMR